ncbi:MAG TPA: hypothetical protein VNO52_03755 [Methylomirabilota bacterium]|nr:hypothetical protein [Methylomirabilota bacterium]
MTDLWLRLLNVPVDDAGRIADATLVFRGGLTTGWFAFWAVAASALAIWLYRLSPITLPHWRRHALATFRALLLLLLLALFLRPVLAFTVEGSIRRVLVLLFDGSSSMQIRDPRVSPQDQIRAAIATGTADPTKGLDQRPPSDATAGQPQSSRLDVVKAAWLNDRLRLLPRLDREFDLAAFSCGRGVGEISARPADATGTNAGAASRFEWVKELTAEGPTTALGDAIREVLNRKRGQPLAGIVLVTDGANNSGSPPREAALLAAQERAPLYIHGVGITDPRDLIVQNLFAPDVTFVKDEVPVTVRVRAQGLAGEEARIVLKLGGEVVARQTLTLINGEQVVALKFTPQSQGQFDLEASIEPRADETVTDNNSRHQRLRIIDARVRVLLVDQSPRWEFRYLQAMLLRDRRVELKCHLVEGDKSIARVAGSPYLAEFPSRKEELFRYDLVILGDLDVKALTTAQLDNLGELVSRFGGALVVVAGRRAMPHGYRRTVLEKMLPVEFDSPTLEASRDPVADKPIQLELTPAGRASAMLKLADKDLENTTLWKRLPPVYWTARVLRPKPAAEVLLVDPDPAKESRFGKMPVFALHQYGLGQVLFVGTDNTWRWRKNAGDLYYTTLWGQIAQRVSIQRLMGGSRRTQLSTDRQNYLTGDRITVFARLYGSGFEPIQEPSVKATYVSRDGTAKSEALLRPLPDQPGLYRAEFVAGAPGHYRFMVENDPETPLEFNVAEPRFEFGETAMNETLLRDLATASGGAFFREEDLARLPDTISARTERVQSPLEVELWCSPLYFLLVVMVAGAEWTLRKLSHLK